MSTFGLKIGILLLGVLSCLVLLQTEAITEASESGEGLVIALRAPTSGKHRLVKCPGSENEKCLKEGVLSLSLPEDTPIFFRVDQVNTVLYTIEIKVTEDKPKAETSKSPDFPKVLDWIEKVIGLFSSGAVKVNPDQGLTEKEGATPSKALENLHKKLKAIGELNRKLDKLLYRSEVLQFYEGGAKDVNKRFATIQEEAKQLTQASLDISEGTPQAICDAATEAIESVHNAFRQAGLESLLFCLPRDLSETSNEIVIAVLATAGKLRNIQTAKWTHTDTETRFLKDQIKYTCVFTPKEEKGDLKQITRVVTVKGYPDGLIIRTTQGVFISKVGETYFLSPPSMDGPKSRKIMAEDSKWHFARSGGVLGHVLYSKFSIVGIAPALTIGLGLDSEADFQAALGGSVLFNATGNRTLALTAGGIVRNGEALRDGYSVEDEFTGDAPPTKKVPQVGWFAAITFNFDSLFSIKGDSKSSKN